MPAADLRAALAAYEAARAQSQIQPPIPGVAIGASHALAEAAAAHLPGLLEREEAQAALIERLREALDDYAWGLHEAGSTTYLKCVSCDASASMEGRRRHAPDCDLAALLAAVDGER